MENEQKNSYRIQSFDYVRGIAIVLMILAHVQELWIQPPDRWATSYLYVFLSQWGVPGFVFASGLSFGFTWKNKKSKGLDDRKNILNSLPRTFILIGIALGYNLFALLIHNGPIYHLWFWNILQTLAICRLLGVVFMKVPKKMRGLLSILIIFLGHFVVMWLIGLDSPTIFSQIIYYIFFQTLQSNSIVLMLPVFIFGTIFGEESQDLIFSDIKKETITTRLNAWLIMAFVIIFFAIILGFNPPPYYYDWERVYLTFNLHPNLSVDSIPAFVSRNTYQWILYSIGTEILLFCLAFRVLDYKNILGQAEKPYSKFDLIRHNLLGIGPQMLGKYSLTIYLFHYLLYLIPWSAPYYLVYSVFFLVAFGIYLMVTAIEKYSKGKFSIEYLITIGAKLIEKDWRKKNII